METTIEPRIMPQPVPKIREATRKIRAAINM